jgi:hypothetical protein
MPDQIANGKPPFTDEDITLLVLIKDTGRFIKPESTKTKDQIDNLERAGFVSVDQHRNVFVSDSGKEFLINRAQAVANAIHSARTIPVLSSHAEAESICLRLYAGDTDEQRLHMYVLAKIKKIEELELQNAMLEEEVAKLRPSKTSKGS